jgi:WhiB family transcriptional regulator, redox-sensing transcriptional regulator
MQPVLFADDPQFWYETQRPLGHAAYGGADTWRGHAQRLMSITRTPLSEALNMLSATSGAPGWQRSAACRSADPELFFPASSSGHSVEQAERAKAVCRVCIVRRQCLQHAIAANEAYGVWGGMTEDERRRAARRARTRATG